MECYKQVKKQPTLMIVDRNAHIRNFLKRELASDAYRVVLAGTSGDILRWNFGSAPPQLLIMDVDLPDITGLDLIDDLRNRGLPVIPVILHSYFSEEIQTIMRLGNIYFVEKGAKSTGLLKKLINRILPNRNLEKFDRNCV